MEEKMKKVDIVVKKELFNGIGVILDQLYASISDECDIYINGSVSGEVDCLKGNTLGIRANLCSENGEILYILRNYNTINFELVKYDAFSIYCSDVSRFFDISALHHVELYPHIKKEEKE